MMQTLSADRILSAIKGKGIEAIGDDGTILLTLDSIPFLAISEAPIPQVQHGPDHTVTILSGDVPILRIDCDSESDAEEIAHMFAELVTVA